MDSLTIVGGGRVGRTLGRLLNGTDILRVEHIVDSNDKNAREARDFIGGGECFDSLRKVIPGKVVMLSVSDDQIAGCAQELSNKKLEEGTIIFHCSGYHSSQILGLLTEKGCHVASIHPVKSFADPQYSVRSFAGIPCTAEGSSVAIKYLRRIFCAIGAEFFTIPSEKKELYHSATVFLSNYVVSLLKVGSDLLAESGVNQEQRQKMLRALCPDAVENCIANGFSNSLTGPVCRGDVETVCGELAVLRKQSALNYHLYKVLGKVAFEIADEGLGIENKKREKLTQLLSFDDFG